VTEQANTRRRSGFGGFGKLSQNPVRGPYLLVPAWTMIGYWALLQLLSGVVSLGAEGEAGEGIAFWAHVAA
jgi:membrane associated rhomboid family serine protease